MKERKTKRQWTNETIKIFYFYFDDKWTGESTTISSCDSSSAVHRSTVDGDARSTDSIPGDSHRWIQSSILCSKMFMISESSVRVRSPTDDSIQQMKALDKSFLSSIQEYLPSSMCECSVWLHSNTWVTSYTTLNILHGDSNKNLRTYIHKANI